MKDMKKIELTTEETEFMIKCLSMVNLNAADPSALQVVTLAHSLLAKLTQPEEQDSPKE